MTDYVTISKDEIEALFLRASKGAAFVSELTALLDKAPSVEPYAYAVDGRMEQLLFFDEGAARSTAEINCGTFLKLYTSPPQAEERITELEKGLTIATKQWHEWKEEAFRLNDRLKKYENGNLMLLNDGEAMEKTNEIQIVKKDK